MKKRIIALLTVFVLLGGLFPALAEDAGQEDWFTFLLMCNEGMSDEGENVGNTMMLVSANPTDGRIKLLMFTWDTFIDYPGYDVPQLIDQPFRVAGPEETMRIFNQNFNLDIRGFLSVNYLNLARIIDAFGGVDVDVTRPERNALNGMVKQKVDVLEANYGGGLLSELMIGLAAEQYYLTEYGDNTHLNGLQAVAFGWLQYDSVYNCCRREAAVIQKTFSAVAETVAEKAVFYDDTFGEPASEDSRLKMNLDSMTEEDYNFIYQLVQPIFDRSYHNLSREEIMRIVMAILTASFEAERNGIRLLDRVEVAILPLEALEPYEKVAGKSGHVIDMDANEKAIKSFLYGEN